MKYTAAGSISIVTSALACSIPTEFEQEKRVEKNNYGVSGSWFAISISICDTGECLWSWN